MSRKLYIIVILGLICFSAHISAQEDYSPRDYSIIPPSPEVASLMKYIELPVSPFTGQPNVNLPIYTIRQGSIEVPVSVSYHSGGIKVFEQGFMGKKKSRQNSNMQLYPSHICLRCSC